MLYHKLTQNIHSYTLLYSALYLCGIAHHHLLHSSEGSVCHIFHHNILLDTQHMSQCLCYRHYPYSIQYKADYKETYKSLVNIHLGTLLLSSHRLPCHTLVNIPEYSFPHNILVCIYSPQCSDHKHQCDSYQGMVCHTLHYILDHCILLCNSQ